MAGSVDEGKKLLRTVVTHDVIWKTDVFIIDTARVSDLPGKKIIHDFSIYIGALKSSFVFGTSLTKLKPSSPHFSFKMHG